MLAREIAAQHQDNRRAFVTTNDCFTSKARKISSLSWRRTDRFPAQNGKDRQTLGLLGLGRKYRQKIDVREKVVCIDRSIVLFFQSATALHIYGMLDLAYKITTLKLKPFRTSLS